MKKFTKFLSIALALACFALCFVCAAPEADAASSSDYDAYRLKSENLIYPSHYYSTEEMTDTPVEHTFVKVANLYPSAAIDNSNKSALCSKPYKFMELYDNWVANGKSGNLVIPCCVIDLARGGDPVEIAGAGMTLRSHFDCQPLHMKIQVATDAAATNWVTVCDADNIQWDSISKRWYFDPIEAYQVRFIALDIDEVNINEEGDYYDPIKGDETRFTYAEVDVFTLKESAGGNSDSTTAPTTATDATSATRPVIQVGTRPTQAATQPATQAPTTGSQSATKAPTQPATQAPTTGGQSATKAPTQPATQAPSGNVTEPTGSTPVEPTVDPSAPTDVTEPEATVDATEPEATVDTTEPEATVEATEPEATTPTTDTTGEKTPDNITTIIIIAIAAAVVIAGAAIFFIIKKKKNG